MRIIILILVFAVWGCSKKADNREESKNDSSKISKMDSVKNASFDYDAQFKLENYLDADPGDISKMQTLNYDCAIIIYPSDEQIEEMKKNEGEDDFFVGADDSNFYQAQAMHLIDSARIRIVNAKKAFLKLQGDQKAWILSIRKKDLPAWNLILGHL